MQPKFTLNNSWVFRAPSRLLLVIFLLFAGKINAQLYVNGNLSTGATSSNGTAAPAGFTWSEVQAGNTTAGFTNNITGFRLADNFVIPSGSWNITKMTFFAYSTGFAGASSPFNDVRVRIYNGAPNAGGTVVFGDVTTNRFLASTTAGMYRIFNATPGTTRQIWAIEATVNTTLAAGTYWVEWGVNNTTPLASNFTPASTVVGQVTQPGNNALQFNVGTNTWAPAVDGANPQDIYFTINYNTGPCSGTPAPGNTIASSAAVCPAVPFSLSLQNATSGSGVTYQWQSAPASSGPWTNISGATNSTYSSTLTATTWFRCEVTCSGNTGTSNPVQVSLNPPSACYCTPTYSNGCALGDFIANVTIPGTTLNNSSACSSPPFTYYSALPAAQLIQGGTYPVNVTVGPDNFGQFVRIWADWNQNGNFSDPGEAVGVSGNAGPNGTVTINMTVPSTATLGTTRMRVRGGDDAAPTAAQSCGASSSTFGEAEDYNININPCVPLAFTTQPSSTSTVCGGNATFTAAVSGSLPTYTWEYRVNASSPWLFVPNAAPFSGVNTATLTITNASQALNGYQFRVLVQGACTATDFSNIATLTVNPIVPVVNPASATICLGSVQALSLTNSVSAPTTVTFNASAGLPLAIPDNNLAGVNNTLAVSGIPAGAVITEVKVRMSIPAHTWIGDICAVVRAPNGQILNLDYFISGTGRSGLGMVNTTFSSLGGPLLSTGAAPYTGTFRADAVTTPAAGNPPSGPTGFTPTTNTWTPLFGTMNGNWTLALFDAFGGDVGSLTAWAVEVTYVSPVLAQGIWGGPAGTIFTDPAATVAYTGTPATTVYVKPTATGVNNYTVSYTTPTPCTSATTTVPVTVHSPITGISVTPATRAVCLGGSTTYTASTTGGSPVNYQWQVSTDGGITYTNISGATSATLTVSGVTNAMNNNRYRATTTGNVCGNVNSAPSTLTVLALPVVNITSSQLQLVPGRTTSITAQSTPAAQTATSWTWWYNGSPLVTTPPSNTNVLSGINIDRLGTYQAQVTDVNGCVNTSNILTVGSEASDRLWIYPNPTTGQFQVRLYYGSNVAEKRTVHIYNQLGQIIMSREIDLVSETPDYVRMDFDLTKQARGVYVVKVVHQYSGKIVSGLLIKQ